jgi:hypothetical protein
MIMIIFARGLTFIPVLPTLCLSRLILGLASVFPIGLAGTYIRQVFQSGLEDHLEVFINLPK